MPNYEIVYLTDDHQLSLSYKTYQRDDGEAVLAATIPMQRNYKSFEIWRDDLCVTRGINPLVPN